MLLNLSSLCAVCSILFSTFMKLSVYPFARGCSGVNPVMFKLHFLRKFFDIYRFKRRSIVTFKSLRNLMRCKYVSQPVTSYPIGSRCCLLHGGKSCPLTDHHKLVVTTRIWFSIVNREGMPRRLWYFRCIDGFLFMFSCSELALETFWYSLLNHAV